MTEVICILITALYFTAGFGVARAIKRIEFFIVFAWPIVLIVFALCGEIA